MRWFLAVTFTTVLVLDIWFARHVANQEIGSATKYHTIENHQQHSIEGPFIIGARDVLVAFIKFSGENEGAITALSTVVIALFTVILARATMGLWKAADQQKTDMRESLRIAQEAAKASMLQARASIAAQIPVVGWVQIKMVEFDEEGRAIAGRDPVLGGPIPKIWRPVFVIQNTGPTRILTVSYAIKSEIIDELAKEPHFGQMFASNLIIKADETHAYTPSEAVVLTDAERRNIDEGSARLWTYGFVGYMDFMDDIHRMGAIAKWDGKRGFVQVARENYSYHDYKKSY